MDTSALFKISHGLYVTGSIQKNGKFCGSCIDAVMVVETDPCQILVSLSATSQTCKAILETNVFSLSVLSENTPMETIRLFGFHSSSDIDKWAQTSYFEKDGLPFLKGACAYLKLKVIKTEATAHHWVFLCEVTEVWHGDEETELTYNTYKQRVITERKN